MKSFYLPALMALFIVCGQTVSRAAAETSAEKNAVDLVVKKFKTLGKRVTSLNLECLSFSSETYGKDVTVRVREIHGGNCGGDPETSPTVAIFNVSGKKVTIEDVVTGEAVPFDNSYKADKDR